MFHHEFITSSGVHPYLQDYVQIMI